MPYIRASEWLLLAIIALAFVPRAVPYAPAQSAPATRPVDAKWKPLFDGKTLDHWSSTNFGGEGEVHVEKGAILLESGVSLTGITYKGDVPKINYEVSLDAQRQDGNDFFCGLTVPVGNSFASLIIGGWGGTLCGISSLDDKDAARNETRTLHPFAKNRWYHIRLRVLADRLQAWIDDEKIVDVSTAGRKIDVRAEVLPSRPFGICAYQTAAALKEIQIRKLAPEEIAPGSKH
jgi:3-keto-disaccharide hydrolase